MKNILIENTKLIGDIARKFGCDLGVAKDRLLADLKSGGNGETGGLITAEVRKAAVGADLKTMNAEYFEWFKELNKPGQPFDNSAFGG